MLKITNKHFLYSTSAFALVLQMGFSLPSFAMNDGSKEEKKVVARKTPSSSSSSSSASSSSSSGRSDRSSLKDLGSAPSYTSQANNSQGSNLKSDPPSYISLSSSSSQAPSYLDEMSMALSDSTINKTSKKHDTDKEVDLENLAKLGKYLETIVKEENASSTRLANTMLKFYYSNTNYYKSTKQNLCEFWMIRDFIGVSTCFDVFILLGGKGNFGMFWTII